MQTLTSLLRHFATHKAGTSQSQAYCCMIEKTIRHVMLYSGDVPLEQVDTEYCRGFIRYLRTAVHRGKPLAAATSASYFRCLNCAINWAVRHGTMPRNPITGVDPDERIHCTESTREHLTAAELRVLMSHPCPNSNVGRAYLFGCLTGLRFSDINALTWGCVSDDNGRARITITVCKTRRTLYLPLSTQAAELMRLKYKSGDGPQRQNVFNLPTHSHANRVLKAWVADCGIKKHITFHTARHTFATLSLLAGTDIYTVSRLLGHTSINTTQLYARIIDTQKDAAVDALGNMALMR